MMEAAYDTRMQDAHSSGEDEELANMIDRDSDDGASSKRKWARMGFGLIFCVSAVVCLWSSFPSAGSRSSLQTSQRGLVQAPQFSAILETQARSLLDQHDAPESDKAAAHVHISAAIKQVETFIQKHLSAEQARKLQNIQLNDQQWRDLTVVSSALTNPKVQHVGRLLLDEVRQNGAAGPAEVGKKISARFAKSDVQGLAQEVLPASLRDALQRRWSQGQEVDKDDVWRVMLDPTGETFNRMRADKTEKSDDDSTAVAKRLLQAAPSAVTPAATPVTLPPPVPTRSPNYKWDNPYPLTGWELAEGITSIVFISAAEIVLHVDLLIPGVDMYWWIHALIFVPAYGLGFGSCYVGNSIWCQLFLGAVGVNALDALLVFMDALPSPTIR